MGESEQKARRLPREQQGRRELQEALAAFASADASEMRRVAQRLKLIRAYRDLGVERVAHLQQIFLHYCTRIFKTGSYMTFDRLQYEKCHLTLDRFFVLLKDFDLLSLREATAQLNPQHRRVEVLSKGEVMRVFKRVSATGKDVTFEQFVACLEGIGVALYDATDQHQARVGVLEQERERRRRNYMKAMQWKKIKENRRRGVNGQISVEKVKQVEGEVITPQDVGGKAQLQLVENSKQEQNNDNFIQELMKSDEVKNFRAAVQEIIQDNQKGKQQKVDVEGKKKKSPLLMLTFQQKVQWFYRLLDIDHPSNFLKKMSQLNLPIFITRTNKKRAISNVDLLVKQKSLVNDNLAPYQLSNLKKQRTNRILEVHNNKQSSKLSSQSMMYSKLRLNEIESQLHEMKQRQRNEAKGANRAQYEERKRRRQGQGSKPKAKRKAKVERQEISADFSAISQMSSHNIKLPSFDPGKLFVANPDDSFFLAEYDTPSPQQPTHQNKLPLLKPQNKATQLLHKVKIRAEQLTKQQSISFHHQQTVSKGRSPLQNKIAAKFAK